MVISCKAPMSQQRLPAQFGLAFVGKHQSVLDPFAVLAQVQLGIVKLVD